MTTTPNPTATTDAPSRAFSIIREVLATPTTATADTIGDKTAARIEQRLKAAGLLVDAPTDAQPVLDENKVAEVIEQMRDRSRKERDVAKESLGRFIARALCEAAKRGELS